MDEFWFIGGLNENLFIGGLVFMFFKIGCEDGE